MAGDQIKQQLQYYFFGCKAGDDPLSRRELTVGTNARAGRSAISATLLGRE